MCRLSVDKTKFNCLSAFHLSVLKAWRSGLKRFGLNAEQYLTSSASYLYPHTSVLENDVVPALLVLFFWKHHTSLEWQVTSTRVAAKAVLTK